MNLNAIGLVVLSNDVKCASDFYVTKLGFKPLVVMDWYASHERDGFEGLYLDIIKAGHEAAGKYLKNQTTSGTMIALIVDDAAAELDRLQALEVKVIMGLQDEPWGQRRFQILGPDDVVVEFIERIAPDADWLKVNM